MRKKNKKKEKGLLILDSVIGERCVFHDVRYQPKMTFHSHFFSRQQVDPWKSQDFRIMYAPSLPITAHRKEEHDRTPGGSATNIPGD